MNKVFMTGVLVLVLLTGCNSYENFTFQSGDIVFQQTRSNQSKALKLATKSQYTHVGMIYKKGKKVYVYEAVQPVKLTPIKKWINNGVDKHYVVKRLKDAEKVLTVKNLKKMDKVGRKFRGRNYDIHFAWGDGRIYCSELVYKIYQRALGIKLGKIERFRDFDLTSPTVKKIVKKRFGRKIPLNQKVISPISMFNSDKLETVYEN